MIVATIYTFFDERKKGLWSIIHNSAGGRYKLAVKRTGILFGLSCFYTFVTYIVTFAVAFKLYGGLHDLVQLIQSNRKYEVTLLVLSRGKFILFYLITHSVYLFVIGMIIWLIMSLIKNTSVSILVTGLIFAVEYISYALIPANSLLCIFKYLNLFQIINPTSSLTEYMNWGYESFIVDTFTSTLIFVAVLAPVTIIATVLVNGRKHPIEQVGFLEKIFQYVSVQIAKGVERLPAFLKELYKVLIIQKGILVILVAVWLVLDNQISRGVMYNDKMTEMSKFYQEANGLTPGDKVESIIAPKEVELAELEENHNATAEEKSIISNKDQVLKDIRSNVDYLSQLKENKGIKGKIINPYIYEDVFGKRLFVNQRNVGIIAIFTEILLLFGTFAFEKKQSMVTILRSSGGRKKLWRQKIFSILLLTAVVWAITYGINWWNITRMYSFHSLGVPIQSLQFMGDFPIKISIGGFLLLVNIYKYIILLSIGFLLMAISIKINYIKALIISCIILVPHILYILGIRACYLMSSVIPLSFTEYWSQYGNHWRSYITASVIVLLGIISYFLTNKIWNKTGGGMR